MIEEMIHALEYTARFMGQSVADLSEEELVEQPSGVPNHATWTLGHVIYSCHAMATELGAEPWLPEDWESVFGYGSTPRSRERRYPKKAELQTLLAGATTRLCEALRGVDASALGRRLSDEGNGDFPTMGDLLLQVIVAHSAYHAGQLAVWRRAMGKESVAVFI